MSLSIRRGVTIQADRPFVSAWFSHDGKAITTTTDLGRQCRDAVTGELLDDALSSDIKDSGKNQSTRIICQWLGQSPGKDSNNTGYRLLDWVDNLEVGFVHEPFPDYCGAIISPNSKYLAIGYQHGKLRLEEIPVNAPIFLFGHDTSKNNHMHQNSISYLEFDSNSRFLVSMADEDDSPLLWDLRQRRTSADWNSIPAFRMDDAIELNSVTDGGIDTLRFSPTDARFVCTHRNEKTAQVWTLSI